MIDEGQFLKDFREAVKRLKARPVLVGEWLRFELRNGDRGRYCPITLLCIHRTMIRYDPSYEIKKAAKAVKVPARLREKINRAADRHPWGYDRNLRRRLMRAAGRW